MDSEDAAWECVHAEFLRWRHLEVESKIKDFEQMSCDPIPFDSAVWWAHMIADRLRNYDMAKRRHDRDADVIPSDFSLLPEFRDPGLPDAKYEVAGDTGLSGDDSDDAAHPVDDAPCPPPETAQLLARDARTPAPL